MRRYHIGKLLKYLSIFSTLLLTMIMVGCEGDKGDAGASGTSSGTITGKVTDTAVPAHNLAGITVSSGVTGLPTTTTDTSGNYSLTLPNGNYTISYSKAGYTTATQSATVVTTVTKALPAVALIQTAAAVVNVANTSFANGTATLSANVLVNDPALVGLPATFVWTDSQGNVVTSTTSGTTSTITVPRPTDASFVAAVATQAQVRQSVYPAGFDPIADENDFDLPFFATLDRFQVLPISQKSFETAALAPYTVTATINGQVFTSTPTASVPTNTLPFVPNGGLRNVPVGQPVVLQGSISTLAGAVQSTWNWTLGPPVGSNLTVLLDPTTRFPHFIPDAPGTYLITETVSGRTMNIYAGGYVGILNPALNDDPLGIVDTSCSTAACHPGNFTAPYPNGVQAFSTTPVNAVFDNWTGSGHRHIMVKGMQEGAHYDINSCGKCHSVGYAQYSSATKSGGFRDVIRATGFTNATFLANAPTFFKGFPTVLRMSEVQCETCHGPNGVAHGTGVTDTIASRFSVSSDVCGTCHGEPPRHGRYQEWRESGHGDFQTAINEAVTGYVATVPSTNGIGTNIGTGGNSGCVGCHSGQGFPLLLSQLEGTNGNPQSPSRTITGTAATGNLGALSFLRSTNVQPQTCPTCHPVHNPGKEPGLVGDIVILRGDYQSGGAFDGTTPLLPSGFQANGVGKGALCITCHNSRNGGAGATATLHEDGDPNFGLGLAAYSAPHEACQGDVLMGHNAYYFSSASAVEDINLPNFTKVPQQGRRSAHSFLADACVTCHLQKAPTDPTLGYPPGLDGAGTNHTFAIVTDKTKPAGDQINALCAQCHGGFQGTGVQSAFDAAYKQLLISAANAVLRVKFGSIAAATLAGTTDLVFIPGRTPQVSIASIAGGVPINLSTYLNTAPIATGTTANPATLPVAGFQRDLAKANWNISLVAAKYNATRLNGSSYDNGTPILNASGGTVGVAGDQSKAVHNPSFVFNVMSVTQARLNAM
jgi:hypothetical protein